MSDVTDMEIWDGVSDPPAGNDWGIDEFWSDMLGTARRTASAALDVLPQYVRSQLLDQGNVVGPSYVGAKSQTPATAGAGLNGTNLLLLAGAVVLLVVLLR